MLPISNLSAVALAKADWQLSIGTGNIGNIQQTYLKITVKPVGP